MKRTASVAILAIIAALLVGACRDSEMEQESKEQEQSSKDFWDMGGPTDRSKSKGFTP